jgi:DNA polymerase eta
VTVGYYPRWARPLAIWPADELLLAVAAVVVAELRTAVTAETGYSCSAGVAHNKLLAKLCCGLHKPCQQQGEIDRGFRGLT